MRKHEITYHRPAVYGDELQLTTSVQEMRGARAVRRTTISLANGVLLAELITEWVWIRATDGRPARVPHDVLTAFDD